MQTTIEISDTAVSELCAGVAKTILSEAGSSDETGTRDMGEIVFAAVQQAERRVARIGTVGHWCYFCGNDDPTKFCFCHCSYPRDLRCQGKLVCEPCRQSHRTLTDHIDKMLSFPVVERADSRRSQYEIRLYRAASRACNPTDDDNYDHTEHRDLAFHLAQADPFGESDVFRAGILRAFRVSKFVAYQALAEELEKQWQESIVRAVRRAFRRRTVPSGAEFYR